MCGCLNEDEDMLACVVRASSWSSQWANQWANHCGEVERIVPVRIRYREDPNVTAWDYTTSQGSLFGQYLVQELRMLKCHSVLSLRTLHISSTRNRQLRQPIPQRINQAVSKYREAQAICRPWTRKVSPRSFASPA